MRRGVACFPRTRGDVPPAGTCRMRIGALPPHTRGCTGAGHRLGRRSGASPAHAGMYRLRRRAARRRGGFPRTRGDVPILFGAGEELCSLPPHTRGCTLAKAARLACGTASPAHAGMYRVLTVSPMVLLRFPRTRGDVPGHRDQAVGEEELPPHTRGCTRSSMQLIGARRASPAHAGMYPAIAPACRWRLSFPRTRGDVPRLGLRRAVQYPLPPHTRGCTPD